MEEKVFYFRYKNGTGDCFEPLSTWEPSSPDGEIQAICKGKRLLYVGFDNGEEPGGTIDRINGAMSGRLEDGSFKTLRQPTESFRTDARNVKNPKAVRDDDFIAWLAHKDNREQVRLITFSAGHLYFWEVAGEPLKIIRKDEAHYETIKAMDKTKRSSPLEMYKFLSVIARGKVRRQDLYTSVDSLAVLQYLTRGTCRPLWKVKGSIPWIEDSEERIKKFPDLEPERKILVAGSEDPARVPAPTKEGKEEEQLFGTFIRKYLDAVLTGDEFFKNMTPEQRRRLVIHTMNPILVETCAYYFCLDLGRNVNEKNPKQDVFDLLPDVGKGKGLDVIDVRARLHPSARNEDSCAQKIANKLEKIAEKLERPKLKKAAEHFRKKKVLELQCKARGTKEIPGLDHVVLFVNGDLKSRKSSGRPTIDLQKFLITVAPDDDDWRLVNRFLDMQVDMLENIPRVEVAKG